jgi:hypothetical protein
LSTAPLVHSVSLNQNVFHERKKPKAMEQSTGSSKNVSPTASINITEKKNVRICLFLEVITGCFIISDFNS